MNQANGPPGAGNVLQGCKTLKVTPGLIRLRFPIGIKPFESLDEMPMNKYSGKKVWKRTWEAGDAMLLPNSFTRTVSIDLCDDNFI